MSNESILVILLVGLIAGWLAGKIVRGTGYGIVADICIGIIGALIGSWLLPQLGIHLGAGIVSTIIGGHHRRCNPSHHSAARQPRRPMVTGLDLAD